MQEVADTQQSRLDLSEQVPAASESPSARLARNRPDEFAEFRVTLELAGVS